MSEQRGGDRRTDQQRTVAQERAAFWARAYERGLTQADVYAALGVARVHDFTGSLEDAGAAIKRYLAQKGGG